MVTYTIRSSASKSISNILPKARSVSKGHLVFEGGHRSRCDLDIGLNTRNNQV